MNMRRLALSLAASSVIVLIHGCRDSDRYYVQREWSLTMREQGIVPIFPPREDVQVGDIFADRRDLNSPEYQKIFLKEWGALDEEEKLLRQDMGMNTRAYRLYLREDIGNNYALSMAAPGTTTEWANVVGNAALDAAKAKKSEAAKEVTEAKAALKAIEDAKVAASKRVHEAIQSHENAVEALRVAKEELEAAKNADPELDEEDLAVFEQEEAEVIRLERAVLDQSQVVERQTDDAERKTEQKKLDDLKLELKHAKERRDAEKATVDRKKADKKADGIAVQQKKVTDKMKAVADAAEEKFAAKQALENATATMEADGARLTAAVDGAQKKEKELDEQLKAIAAAGERIRQQPKFAERDSFTGSGLAFPGMPEHPYNLRTNRLRQVGFPEFSTATFTQGDLNALIPIEAFTLGLNVSWASAKRVSVKIPAADMAEIEISELVGREFGTDESHSVAKIAMAAKAMANAYDAYAASADVLQRLNDLAEGLEDEALRGDFESQIKTAVEDVGKKMAAWNTDRTAWLKALREGPTDAETVRLLCIVDLAGTKRMRVSKPVLEALRYDIGYYKDLLVDPSRIEAVARDPRMQAESESQGKTWDAGLKEDARAWLHRSEATPYAYVTALTAVYYARALDVSVFYGSARGFKAKGSVIPELDDGESEMAASEVGGDVAIGNTAADGQQLLDGVEGSLGTTMKVPGGSVQLVKASETTIGLRRVFDRPMAIGYRGKTYRVDLRTGDVVAWTGQAATPIPKQGWTRRSFVDAVMHGFGPNQKMDAQLAVTIGKALEANGLSVDGLLSDQVVTGHVKSNEDFFRDAYPKKDDGATRLTVEEVINRILAGPYAIGDVGRRKTTEDDNAGGATPKGLDPIRE